MSEYNNVPKIRFKGFTGVWEQRKLEEISNRFDNLRVPVSANEREKGTTPYYGANGIQDYVKGFTHNGEYVLIAEDGANDLKNYPVKYVNGLFWANNHVHVVQGKEGICDNKYLKYCFTKTNIESLLVGGGRAKLNANIMMSIDLTVPSFNEQVELGRMFYELDNLITLHQRKCDTLVNVKKSLLEKMFPKNSSNIPEIRFKGFTDVWEQRKLGDLMDITSVKRIHQSDWTESGIRFLRARDIVADYKKEEVEDKLYISKEKYEEYSLISGKVQIGDLLVTGVGTIGIPYLIRNNEPIYFKDGNIIWFKNNNKIDDNFLYYSFVGSKIQNFINEKSGVGTVGTYTIQSGKETPIMLTNNNEQSKISNLMSNLDNLITLHQRKLEKVNNIKKSMLDKMFV